MSMVGMVRELWEFIRERKKMWLLPIIVILFLLSAFIIMTESTVLAPFIYALF